MRRKKKRMPKAHDKTCRQKSGETRPEPTTKNGG